MINLSSRTEDGLIELSIADNGLGIDLKLNRDKIFGMYKTFHNNKDARGIGLFITKNQIEAMGGKVTVESEVNKGTTFKIYFKQAQEALPHDLFSLPR
ncbi:Alkaline phosphatase synthesis sensor protein PhoR [compost metagenome]